MQATAPPQQRRAARDLASVLLRTTQRLQVAAFEAIKWRCRAEKQQQLKQERIVQPLEIRRQRCKLAAQELRRQLGLCKDAVQASGDAAEVAILAGSGSGSGGHLGRDLRRPPQWASLHGDTHLQEATTPSPWNSSCQHPGPASNGLHAPMAPFSCSTSSSSTALSPSSPTGVRQAASAQTSTVRTPPASDEDRIWKEFRSLVAGLGEERPKWAKRFDSLMKRLEAHYSSCKAERDALKECWEAKQPADRRAPAALSRRFVGVDDGVRNGVVVPSITRNAPHPSTQQAARRNRTGRGGAQDGEEVIFVGCAAASPDGVRPRTVAAEAQAAQHPQGGEAPAVVLASVKSNAPVGKIESHPRPVQVSNGSTADNVAMPRTGPPQRTPQPVPSVRISLLGESREPVPKGSAVAVTPQRRVASEARSSSPFSSDSTIDEDEASDSDATHRGARPASDSSTLERPPGNSSTPAVPSLGKLSERLAGASGSSAPYAQAAFVMPSFATVPPQNAIGVSETAAEIQQSAPAVVHTMGRSTSSIAVPLTPGGMMRTTSTTLYTPRATAQLRGSSAGGTPVPSPDLRGEHSQEQLIREGLTNGTSYSSLQGSLRQRQGAYTPRMKSNPSLRSGAAGPMRGTQAPTNPVRSASGLGFSDGAHFNGLQLAADGRGQSRWQHSGAPRHIVPQRMLSGALLHQSGLQQHPTIPPPVVSIVVGTSNTRSSRAFSSSVSPRRSVAHASLPPPVASALPRPTSSERTPPLVGAMIEQYAAQLSANTGNIGQGGDQQRRATAAAAAAAAHRAVVMPAATATVATHAPTTCAAAANGVSALAAPGPAAMGLAPALLPSAAGKAYSSTIQLWTPRAQRATSASQAAAIGNTQPSGVRREVSAEPRPVSRSPSASLGVVSPRPYPQSVIGVVAAPAMPKFGARR